VINKTAVGEQNVSYTSSVKYFRLNVTVVVMYKFLPRDASAERVDATVSRPSVRPSVCLSVRNDQVLCSNTLWNSSKIISRPNSLRPMCSLTPNMGDLVQREHPQT